MCDYLESLFGGRDNLIIVVIGVLLLCYIINIVYKGFVLLRQEKLPKNPTMEGVSVVLTVNNRADKLEENLETYLTQDYENYEVIVVDDGSEDNTKDVLNVFQSRYPNLHTTHISSDTYFRNTKKVSINIGILSAKYDIVLFSEINCKPVSKNWIRSIASCFESDTAVVMGYANFSGRGWHNLLHYAIRLLRFIRLYILTSQKHIVYGDGYNMAYRKSLYKQRRIFSCNAHSYLGYDSEVVRELGKMGKVYVTKQQDAAVQILDNTKEVWRMDYMNYATYYYKRDFKLIFQRLLGSPLRLIIYIALFCYLQSSGALLVVLLLLVLTFFIDITYFYLIQKHLAGRNLFITSFVVNTIGIFYRMYLNLYSQLAKRRWT